MGFLDTIKAMSSAKPNSMNKIHCINVIKRVWDYTATRFSDNNPDEVYSYFKNSENFLRDNLTAKSRSIADVISLLSALELVYNHFAGNKCNEFYPVAILTKEMESVDGAELYDIYNSFVVNKDDVVAGYYGSNLPAYVGNLVNVPNSIRVNKITSLPELVDFSVSYYGLFLNEGKNEYVIHTYPMVGTYDRKVDEIKEIKRLWSEKVRESADFKVMQEFVLTLPFECPTSNIKECKCFDAVLVKASWAKGTSKLLLEGEYGGSIDINAISAESIAMDI
ncbi:MAG: hypothetical protein IKL53_08170 [Lachnospiraceae bacterium]|nr:hypothetical protein [Lachnospiraceae bacterium]